MSNWLNNLSEFFREVPDNPVEPWEHGVMWALVTLVCILIWRWDR